MSFEIRPTEQFWREFHDLLSIPAQESVLDIVESMREHPGEFIERPSRYRFSGTVTRPLRFEAEAGPMVVRILFQYDDDEATIHLYSLIVAPDEF